MLNRVELLVHAGAPSTRRDDERFKAQANAYFDFDGEQIVTTAIINTAKDAKGSTEQSSRLQDVTSLEATPSPEQGRASLYAGEDFRDDMDITWDPTATFLEDTQIGLTALESQLASGSIRLSGKTPKITPAKRKFDADRSLHDEECMRRDERVRLSAPAFEIRGAAQDGQIQQAEGMHEDDAASPLHTQRISEQHQSCPTDGTPSSYLKSPDFAKRARIERDFPQRKPRSNSLLQHLAMVLEDNRPALVDVGRKGNQFAQRSADSSKSRETTSELPTTYSLSDFATDSSNTKSVSIWRSASDPGPAVDGAQRFRPTTSNIHEVTAQQASQPELEQTDARPGLPTTASNVCAEQQHQASATEVPPAATGSISQLPVLVHAPPPETTTGTFDTHVTEALCRLSKNMVIASRYKPVFTTREILPLERGYWLLDCGPWPITLQLQFWEFLAKMISSGNAGWGVWCTRETDGVIGRSAHVVGRQPIASPGSIKIFCWGEVVKHIYLVLYVASQGKARKSGLRWVDAIGETVVQMPGR